MCQSQFRDDHDDTFRELDFSELGLRDQVQGQGRICAIFEQGQELFELWVVDTAHKIEHHALEGGHLCPCVAHRRDANIAILHLH